MDREGCLYAIAVLYGVVGVLHSFHLDVKFF
jgi:hypothetical protein